MLPTHLLLKRPEQERKHKGGKYYGGGTIRMVGEAPVLIEFPTLLPHTLLMGFPAGCRYGVVAYEIRERGAETCVGEPVDILQLSAARSHGAYPYR